MKTLFKNKKGIVGTTLIGIASVILGLLASKNFLIFIGIGLLAIGFLPFFSISSIPWYIWGVAILVIIIAVLGKKR